MLFETGNISETMVANIVIVSIIATPETEEILLTRTTKKWHKVFIEASDEEKIRMCWATKLFILSILRPHFQLLFYFTYRSTGANTSFVILDI